MTTLTLRDEVRVAQARIDSLFAGKSEETEFTSRIPPAEVEERIREDLHRMHRNLDLNHPAFHAWRLEGEEAATQAVSDGPEVATPPARERAKRGGLAGEPYVNSLGMKFVWIPPGKFVMGKVYEGDKGKYENNVAHPVTLSQGFYMSIFPVTNAQWDSVMQGDLDTGKRIPYATHRDFERVKTGANVPVEFVSWSDCQAFLQKLTAIDERKYRLPTEAEWEYACRAGSTALYFFGDDVGQLREYAHYAGGFDFAPSYAIEVGARKPNPWGLHEMHGNVREWCQDWFGDYAKGEVTDPLGPVESRSNARIYRGGSASCDAELCASATRGWLRPDSRGQQLGFRVVLSVC